MCMVMLNCISLYISVFLCLCLPDWRINVFKCPGEANVLSSTNDAIVKRCRLLLILRLCNLCVEVSPCVVEQVTTVSNFH